MSCPLCSLHAGTAGLLPGATYGVQALRLTLLTWAWLGAVAAPVSHTLGQVHEEDQVESASMLGVECSWHGA